MARPAKVQPRLTYLTSQLAQAAAQLDALPPDDLAIQSTSEIVDFWFRQVGLYFNPKEITHAPAHSSTSK